MHNLNTLAIVLILSAVVLATLLLIWRLSRNRRISSSKTHLESTFDSIDDPLAIVSRDFRLMRVNKSYAALVEKSFQELIGQNCYRMLRDRDTPCEDCRLQSVLGNHQREYVEYSQHPRSPAERTASFTFYPFYLKEGQETAVVEHIRDTTEVEFLKRNLEKQNRILTDTTMILKRTQKEIDEELEMARLVQQSTLPQKLPDLPGITFDVTYHPIEAVGGDLYDFIRFDEHRIGIFIGDASGHGMPSSLVSTISKMALYNRTKTEMSTNQLMHHINNDLIGNVRTGHYLTCFWGIFNNADNTLIYSRAGHPMPIVARANGEVIQLDAVGIFAGIIEKPGFEQRIFHFQKGDRCYLFTDGIFEVANPADEKHQVLGFKKFTGILKSVANEPFSNVIPAIKESLSAFTYDDDYTLIVFDVTEDRPCNFTERFPGFSPNEPIAFTELATLDDCDDELATLYSTLNHFNYKKETVQQIKLVLNELIANGFIHGNHNEPGLKVTVAYRITSEGFKACVVDEGEGFDIDSTMDPTRSDNIAREGGRGVFLVKKYVNTLSQNSRGNGIFFSCTRKQS